MAILRFKDAQKLSEKELTQKKAELRKDLMRLKSQAASGTAPENPGKIKEIKRTIARILTISERREVKK